MSSRQTQWRHIVERLESRRLLARVAVIGDFTSGTTLNGVSRMIKGWDPAAIVTVGDNYYYDTSIDTSVGQAFHDYISPYSGSYGAGSTTGNRFWPTLGNHDYDRGLSNYTNYFALPNNERYYAAPVQDDIQFFVVNSNTQETDGTSATSKQATWLKNALAASTATWKIVTFHHPAYTSGTEGDNTYMQWPFQQWGASAVISGHDHIYERLLKNNFLYFVDGLGGAEIVPAQRVEPGSQVRYWSDYGAMLLESTATTLNFKFFSRDGVIRDDYTITNSGGTPTSPSTTTMNLIPAGATWKYLDTGVNAGTAWRSIGYDDSAWKSGAAQLGYGDGDETTVVSYGPSATKKYVTTYFRKHFAMSDPSAIASLTATVLRDDGAVLYVNGTEVFRTNMPSGTIGYTTLASSAIEDNTYYAASISPSLLVAGDNVISVEIHQATIDSSDISFDLTLDATTVGGTTTTPPPVATAPAAPSGLSATEQSSSSIALVWVDNSTDEGGFAIERSADGGATFAQITTVAAGVTSYVDGNLAASTAYVYRVRAFNTAGNSMYSNTATATTEAATSVLPAPWASADIGAVGLVGSSAYSNGTFTIQGGGGDIWNSADAFRFVYQPVGGDTTIVARVTGVANTNGWAKAGVMIRESLAANAREASVSVTPTNGTVMTTRTVTGGTTAGTYSTGAAPMWLKLVRSGNTFTVYRSTNGSTWTKIGSKSITMTSSVYVGLCVAAKNTAALNQSTFDHVTVQAAVQQAATLAAATTTTTTSTKRHSATSDLLTATA